MNTNDNIQKVDRAIDELEKMGITPHTAINQDPDGLGDTVANILARFGVTEDAITEALGVGGCGCSKRRQFLNKIFPYRNRKKT